ncbi:MAG: hypothetical protein E7153_04000 [Enterococcus faecium]|uniref:Cadherin domain-containing protein n=1 Tax=Enterococcus mundtii TaxID=53346 RepID=A0A2T5DB02_ENTMU|nr:hypothetical protein [Enterococcus mundtii]MBE6171994.1 hypothetical protein [Enterococcus faecium]PTO34794.1 hypothetical protein C6N14_10465 [Enterococcus mundtii]
MKKRKTMCQLMLLGLTVSTMMVPVSHVSAAIQSVEKSKENDSLQTSQLNQSLLGSITSDQEQINRLDQKYELVAYDATVLPEKIDSKSLLVAADAKVVDEEGEPLSGFTPYVKATTVEAKPGEYQLTVGLKEDASVEKTVKVTVLNEKQETKYTILAEDVTVLVGQTATDYILKVAGAYARNEKGELFDVIVKSSNVENQLGEYEMTLGIKEDPRVERTIKVTVSDKESYVFSAQDATVMVGQTDEASIISAANVEITNQRGEAVDAKAVIKSSTVQDFPGTYLATIAVDQDMTIEKTITVTVMQANEDTVGQPNYQLLAEDTIVSIGQTDEQSLIVASGAYAIDATTGKVGQVVVKQSTVQNTPGEYDVTFGVIQDDSIEKKVKITVQNPEDQPKYHLNVLEKNITLQVGQTDEATILWASGAEVKDQDGYLTYEAKPIIKSSTVENKAGVYEATIAVDKDLSIEQKIQVTVIGEETTEPELSYELYANDGFTTVGRTDARSIIEVTNAQAYDSYGNMVAVIVKNSTIEDKAGVYKVTLGISQDSTIEKTVNVTVEGEETEIPNSDYFVIAEDAEVKVGQTDDYSLLLATNAYVFNQTLGKQVVPIIKHSTVKDTPGEYEVTIGIEQDERVEKTVKITVVGEQVPQQEYILNAADAAVTVGQTDDQSILAAVGATVTDLSGQPVDARPVIKASTVKDEVGYYEVTIGIDKGDIEKTVEVIVRSENLTEGYTFLAEDAVITADEIDDASIIKATNARTVYSDGKVVKGAVIKENNVLPIPGEYEVVLMANQYGFGAKTVKVTVVAVN